ncbi:hypothetical protein B0H14DRAFT_2741341 [Mycena olivaceomarginata]|nr:hypothetical protein B0H14DRAFT_2741341 [Mycena olivaceomarginata]
MQMLLVLQVLAAAAVPALAQITTFAVIGCTGATSVAPCDGSCHSFVGKNAFRVTAGSEHCVTAYGDAACTSPLFPNPNQNGNCEAIESGNPVLALSCSPTNTC